LFALVLGGTASNVIDVYLWPGGVPDFIPMGDWVWNPADFAIYGAILALMAWPVWKLFRIARRHYPLPVPVLAESAQRADEIVAREQRTS
jgi:Signal peptidase (SPase) II